MKITLYPIPQKERDLNKKLTQNTDFPQQQLINSHTEKAGFLC